MKLILFLPWLELVTHFKWKRMAKVMVFHSRARSWKTHGFCLALSWVTCFPEISWCVAAPTWPVGGEEQRPAAIWEPSWKWLLHSKASCQRTAAMANSLTVTSREPQARSRQVSCFQVLSHRNCEITNICWFKLLNLVNLLHSNKKQYAANRRGGCERVLIRGMSTWKGQEGKTWCVWGHENR